MIHEGYRKDVFEELMRLGLKKPYEKSAIVREVVDKCIRDHCFSYEDVSIMIINELLMHLKMASGTYFNKI